MEDTSLRQYIELYRSQHQTLDAASPEAIRRLRPAALSALEATGRLPRKGDEGYERTSLEDVFAPDLGVNLQRMCFEADLADTFRCDVPKVSTMLGLIINDIYRPTASLLNQLPQGVTLCSFSEAAEKCPQVLQQYLGSLADMDSDAATALNTLLLQDGILLHVAKGVKLEKPLQIVAIFNAPLPMLALRRILIVMEADSEARVLLCDHSRDTGFQYVNSQVVEAVLAEGAALDVYEIEEANGLTSRVSRFYGKQQSRSRLTVNGTTLSGGVTRNDYIIDVDGDRCETRLAGMVTAIGKQKTDNSPLLRHHGQHCHSEQLFKYVLSDDATGAFEGLIVVDEGAVKTEAYQSNRNLLAATGARMHTRPQLLIYCDDVKCSHGATTGQLDERAMFYMRSRGIPMAEARMMLMQAFMADVIDTISLEGLRERLRHLVERRLYGSDAICGDCNLKFNIKNG